MSICHISIRNYFGTVTIFEGKIRPVHQNQNILLSWGEIARINEILNHFLGLYFKIENRQTELPLT